MDVDNIPGQSLKAIVLNENVTNILKLDDFGENIMNSKTDSFLLAYCSARILLTLQH